MSSAAFYDVFLSHSSKDKAVVHQLAQKLKSDGLRFWLDAWEIRAGDNIPAEIGKGLERLRSACLAMPSAPIGTLENRTFRFRDPFNNERRFILLRLDDAEPKGRFDNEAHQSISPASSQKKRRIRRRHYPLRLKTTS